MSGFDPKRPISDASVFYPRGMYVDNHSSGKKGIQAEDDADKAFVFDASDMKALNRFLGTGRQLQTTRAEYLRWLGIRDSPEEISVDLGKELTALLGTYAKTKADCVEFKEKTWAGIVDVAGDIKSYATMSGGKESTSYYVLMLDFIGKYHEENEKDKPDEKKLEELKEGIKFTITAQLNKLGELQAGAAQAITGLGRFENVCKDHSQAVETNATSLANQLIKEGNDIETMEKKIKQALTDINEYQGRIDGKNEAIRDAPKYMWVWPIGTAIGTGIVIAAKKERARLQEAMEEVEALLKEYESKMKAASRLKTNMSFISTQVGDLSKEISPAILTLQKLQGAWKSMETDLKGIKDLVEFDTDSIPPMIVARPGLQSIVDEWNKLKEDVTVYIQNAYISDDPKSVSIGEYIAELNTAIRTIEAMKDEAD